jgi:hypothetical protein
MKARTALLLAVLAWGCSSEEAAPTPDLFPNQDWSYPDHGAWPDFPLLPDLGSPDTAQASLPTLFGPEDVSGASCQNAWADTGATLPGSDCHVHLQSLLLGAGAGPEPDRYGCRVQGTSLEAYLYELDCDDTGKVGLSCGGFCGGSGLTSGSIDVSGLVGCSNGWKDSGANIGANKSCVAFVGYVQLGVGDGPEPDVIGCRYNPSTGAVEAYLYELGCDDKGKIAIRCDWVCWSDSQASAGVVSLDGSKCATGWQSAGPSLGAGKTCVVGIERVKLGVGSGPEPNGIGCRYDATSGQISAQLHELDCDDKDVELDCSYVCFD